MPPPLPATRPRHVAPIAGVGRASSRAAAAFALIAMVLASTPGFAAELEDRAAAWVADDARVLGRAAPRLVDAALALPFDAMDRRVGAYADWVYGWFSSLLTAWDLAATGASEAQREISAGRMPDTGALYDRLAEVVQQRFDETVVLPEHTDEAIAAGWRRAMTRVSALDASLTAGRRAQIERAAARLGVDPGPALERFGAPLLAASVTASDPPANLSFRALSDVEGSAGGTADRVLVRSLRPLATQALSVTTRVLLAPVAGGLVASPIAGTNGIAAAVAALTVVSTGIWGVDYAINRLDGELTRAAFEAELRFLVRDAHLRASRLARRHAATTVCAALADTAPCDTAPPVAGAARDG